MKKILLTSLIYIILGVTIIFSGCNRVASAMNGSGKIIDSPINASDFTYVNIAGPFQVEIIHTDNYNVILSTDDNLVSRVLVSLEDHTLKVSIQAPASFFPTSLKLKIEMPDINNLVLTENVKGSISGFPNINSFYLSLKKGSSLNGFLEATNINFDLSGKSRAMLKGKADRLQLECGEESRLDLTDLPLSSANIRVIKSSVAIINVNGRFDVIMDGASKIYYLGNPVFSNTSITGGSTMSRK
jgi:hypothetical protein